MGGQAEIIFNVHIQFKNYYFFFIVCICSFPRRQRKVSIIISLVDRVLPAIRIHLLLAVLSFCVRFIYRTTIGTANLAPCCAIFLLVLIFEPSVFFVRTLRPSIPQPITGRYLYNNNNNVGSSASMLARTEISFLEHTMTRFITSYTISNLNHNFFHSAPTLLPPYAQPPHSIVGVLEGSGW